MQANQLLIKVVIQEKNIAVACRVDILKQVTGHRKLSEHLASVESTQRLCEQISTKLVVEVTEQRYRFGDADQLPPLDGPTLRIVHDKNVSSMADELSAAKQQRFQEILRQEEGRGDDQNIQMELRDVLSLQVPLATLASSPKASQVTVINQKLYKVTAYFVAGHPGFQPSVALANRLFEWHFIYVEVAHRQSDQQVVFAVTERDLVSIMLKMK